MVDELGALVCLLLLPSDHVSRSVLGETSPPGQVACLAPDCLLGVMSPACTVSSCEKTKSFSTVQELETPPSTLQSLGEGVSIANTTVIHRTIKIPIYYALSPLQSKQNQIDIAKILRVLFEGQWGEGRAAGCAGVGHAGLRYWWKEVEKIIDPFLG